MSTHLKITLLILSIFCVEAAQAEVNIKPSDGKDLLAKEIYQKITSEHFFKGQKFIALNVKLGQALREQLDPQKIYFTKMKLLVLKETFNPRLLRLSWKPVID